MMESTNVIGDRFFIVVENNDEVFLQTSSIIDSLQGHASGQGAITNDGDNFEMLSLKVTGHC